MMKEKEKETEEKGVWVGREWRQEVSGSREFGRGGRPVHLFHTYQDIKEKAVV